MFHTMMVKILLMLLSLAVVAGCADQKKQSKSLIQSAAKHRTSDNHAEAIQDLTRAIALDARQEEAFYLRGLSHAALNHSDEAIADLTTATRLSPLWADAWRALGIAQQAKGETALAVKSLTESIRHKSGAAATHYDRGCALAELGDEKHAIDDFATVLRLMPKHEKALVKHAAAIMRKQPDLAVTELTQVIELNRENADAWLFRGLAQRLNNQPDRALADLNVACRFRSADYRPWLERGRILLQLERPQDAVSDLTTAVQLGTSEAECHYELARAFAAGGNITAAEANLRQALKVAPGHPASLLTQIRWMADRGEHAAAVQFAEQHFDASVVEKDPDLASQIAVQQARSLLATGRGDEALQLVASVMVQKPTDPEVIQLRAQILVSLNRSDEAVADYTRLISLSSSGEQYLLRRGKLFLEAGRLRNAMQDASLFLQKAPDSVEALTLRAEIHSRQGDTALAIVDLTSALNSAPENVDLLRRRAQLHATQDDHSSELDDLQRVSQLEPSDFATAHLIVQRLRSEQTSAQAVKYLNELADRQNGQMSSHMIILRTELLLETEEAAAAESVLNQLSDTDKSTPAVRVLQAKIAVAMKEELKALQILSVDENSDVGADVHLIRGNIYRNMTLWQKAVTEYSACLFAEPADKAALTARAQTYISMREYRMGIADASTLLMAEETAEALQLRGMGRYHLGFYRDALDDLDSMAVREADSAEIKWVRCRCFMELDEKIRAREELNDLIQANPVHVEARTLRAGLAEQQGEFDVAIEDLSFLVAQDPDNVDSRMLLGLLRHRRGNFQAAIDDFSQVIQLKPEFAEAFYRRGLACHQLQQTEQAVRDLDTSISLNGKSAEPWYVKGNISAASGDIADALSFYQKAVDLAPSHAAAWYNRGNILFNESQLEEAVESWTKAIELQPGLFRAYNNRAAALVKLNCSHEAVADYERAIELSPGFARARDNFAWLLATSEDPEIQDRPRAVFMARKACELTSYKDWSCISTLAAAYAEAGDLTQATAWAQKARDAAPESQKEELEALVRTYEGSRNGRPSSSTAVRGNNIQRQ